MGDEADAAMWNSVDDMLEADGFTKEPRRAGGIYDDAREIVERGAIPSARGLAPKFAQALCDLVEAAEKAVRLHDESRFKESVECWPDEWPCVHGEPEPHEFEMEVCGECGHDSDGDAVVFRPWPCPTFTALDATVRRIREETT